MRANVTLKQPRATELLAANVALVRTLVREHVHRQRRHGHVTLAAVPTGLCLLAVEAAVSLLVAGKIRGGRVGFAAYGTRIRRGAAVLQLRLRHVLPAIFKVRRLRALF